MTRREWFIVGVIALAGALGAAAVLVEIDRERRYQQAFDRCVEYARAHVPEVLPEAWCEP